MTKTKKTSHDMIIGYNGAVVQRTMDQLKKG